MTAFWHTFAGAAALLTHIHPAFALAAFVVFLCGAWLAGARWCLILRALGATCTTWTAVVTYSAGVFVGNVTPMRTIGNDAARIALIRTRSDASLKAATASVVYDRVSELPAVAVVFLLAIPTLHPSLAIVFSVTAVLAVLALVPAVRRGLTKRVAAWHETIVGVPVGGGSVAAALACSVGVWL
ncbi:MAG TPA: flippase-like domain-containing protein, partial [Vicinamibacterales bacterium]|nr:flippase-like domain-containing protein [Vicinamibacterales bacterium]